MKALKKQLIFDINNHLDGQIIETVFIGGGTPSTIKAFEYEDIFKIIKPHLKDDAEITIECNPNSATKQWLEDLYKLGVNRVSFGVQSFNDEKLKFLNRAHNSEMAQEAIKNAACIGFNGINCDIIYGVKGDSFESLKKDFDTVFSLPVTHLSAYSLTIEEGTKFFNKSSVKIDDEELSYRIFDYLSSHGFNQYEISNFTKITKQQSKHNFGYWQHKNYLGVGAGAVGFVENKRYYPFKSLEEYIANPTFYEYEELTKEDLKVEKVLLGLRCINGFNKNLLNSDELKRAQELVDDKKIYLENDFYINKNFLLADEIALYILE